MTREELLTQAKPILFNTEMVKAILEGRKTVTRRGVKYKYDNTEMKMHTDKYGTRLIEIQKNVEGETHGRHPDGRTWQKLLPYIEKKPPFKKGDYLYVRETWKYMTCSECESECMADNGNGYCDGVGYRYKADGEIEGIKWKPSLYMPKEAARIFLKITDVRVERLQDIMKSPHGPNNQVVREGCTYGCDFIAVWESTIKKSEKDTYGWEANPWVWVIEFERVEV